MIMVFATWNSFSIPIEIAFKPAIINTWYYFLFNSIINFIFVLDIIVTFRTTYI